MSLRQKFFLILNLTILLLWAVPVRAADEMAVTDLKWQEREGVLSYNLSRDGLIKIRVGSFAGPVYRTIVNMEKRAKGSNQEHWDGKDESGKVDFLKYGKMHFCAGEQVQNIRDTVLKLKLNKVAEYPDEITVDVEQSVKPLFLKYGGELRIYVDNKLKKIEIVKSFPFTAPLKIENLAAGRHLLTVNLWQALVFNTVAYNSYEVIVPEKKIAAGAAAKKSNSLKDSIAFCKRDKEGFWQIFLSDINGANMKPLTSTPMDKRYPAWSPDGERIAYVNSLGELWMMDRSGDNNQKINLPMRASEPKFSPDNKNIIFTGLEDVYHGNTKIWQVNLVNSQLTKLVNRPWLQYNPGYSPDGAAVIFTDGPELFEQNILKLDIKTGDITKLTDNGPYDYDMQAAFLNSGEEIVYSTNEGGADYKIYKMDRFGRDKIKLSPFTDTCDTMPAVTKDDNTVFFLSVKNGRSGIWRMKRDGTGAKQVTPDGEGINSFAVYTE